jgi:polysaccharide pyruvyl transferase WcaK-like protein
VRDKKSQEILKKLSLAASILPDPVLTYPEQETKNTKTIGIALRK